MEVGIPYPIEIVNGAGYVTDECAVWVDWNHDGDFDDVGEAVPLTNSTGSGPYTGIITPPSGATVGNTRMRIRIHDSSSGATLPCGTTTTWGEVEDYTINVVLPGPMVYQSTAVTQDNTSDAQTCDANVEVIGIEIVTSGSLSPLDITNFVIRTTGSTSPAISNSNVSNIDIFYTGNNSEFATTNLFGSAPPQPVNIDIPISGSQTLSTGTNYFWVTYDMNASSANIGDLLDARLNQIAINGTNHVIAAGEPAGSRTITPCVPSPGGVSDNNTFWLDGTVGNITKDGSNRISKWTSPVMGGYSLTQNTLDKRPIYHEADAAYNHNPYIKFDGVNDELMWDYAGDMNPNPNFLGNNGTVIIVSAPWYGSDPANETIFAHSSFASRDFQIKPAHNCGYGYGAPNSGPHWQMEWNSILPNPPTPTSRPQIFGIKAGDASSGFAFKNGLYGTAYSTTVDGAVVDDALIVGSRGNAPGGYEYSPASVSEVILYNRPLSTDELDKIQSYLALKYGITLGQNGTATNYYAADGSIVWNASANAGYNYDIAGVGREDISGLHKRKSHSINGTVSDYSDILTVVSGEDLDSPADFANNSTYFIWGRNDQQAIGNYLFDVAPPVITRFARVWKSQTTGNAGMLTLEFDMKDVPGVGGVPGANDLNAVRLLVDADGVFASGAIEIEPFYVDNVSHIVRFQHDFDAVSGYYFTIGSVDFNISPLPIELTEFTADCNGFAVQLNWTTKSESNNAFFTVEKSKDAKEFLAVATIDGNGSGSSTVHYSWRDVSHKVGTAYYRLKQTDFNGRSEYHHVVGADCGGTSAFRIYPNPTKDGVFIENDRSSEMDLDVEVYNAFGQLINRMNLSQSTWIKLPEARGIYFLRVKDGNKVFSEKVVKY